MVALDDKEMGKLSLAQNGTPSPRMVDNCDKTNFEAPNESEIFKKKLGVETETEIYTRRWLQIGIFFIHGIVNGMQWIQFTIIGHIISRYYGVSSLAVDWTSIIFHASYMTLVFPATYLMDRVGLRWTCLISAIGTSVGSWIKFFSVSPDRFMWVFIGQALVGTSQILVTSTPPKLAANWFGPKEVATATAIGCSSVMTGVSLFFFITPILIQDHERLEDIGEELSNFCLVVAVVSTAVTLAVFSLFLDEPLLPPSEARALQKNSLERESRTFWVTFKRILTNRTFVMLWNSYGMSLGFLNAVSILLNPLFLAHFKDGAADAGKLGLLMNLPGIFGSIIFGMILDKTKAFKALSIFIYVFSLVGSILFAVGLVVEVKWLVFVSVIVVGIFTISHASIGFELSAEATYPEPEEVSSGILNLAQHVYGTTMAVIVGSLLRIFGDIAAHICLAAILLVGLILTICTKDELKRQNAGGETHYDSLPTLEVLEIV